MSVDHCILIAEDDAIIRRMTVKILQPCGYCLLQARDGLEALNIAEHHDGEIDLLISDVNMPQMMATNSRGSSKMRGPKFAY
jgi:two-component system, cell cycle sensor histidine kinase and response regulator CckA